MVDGGGKNVKLITYNGLKIDQKFCFSKQGLPAMSLLQMQLLVSRTVIILSPECAKC